MKIKKKLIAKKNYPIIMTFNHMTFSLRLSGFTQKNK